MDYRAVVRGVVAFRDVLIDRHVYGSPRVTPQGSLSGFVEVESVRGAHGMGLFPRAMI